METLLFAGCSGPVTWEDGQDELMGGCADPNFPTLPSPAENPNPDSLKIRVRIVSACSHPDFAEAAGCSSSDPEATAKAEESMIVEYRDGLFPILPGDWNFCPLLASPAS